MSMMVSFVLSFFPRDVLDEILNLIESVSEDFPSYSFVKYFGMKYCITFKNIQESLDLRRLLENFLYPEMSRKSLCTLNKR